MDIKIKNPNFDECFIYWKNLRFSRGASLKDLFSNFNNDIMKSFFHVVVTSLIIGPNVAVVDVVIDELVAVVDEVI